MFEPNDKVTVSKSYTHKGRGDENPVKWQGDEGIVDDVGENYVAVIWDDYTNGTYDFDELEKIV